MTIKFDQPEIAAMVKLIGLIMNVDAAWAIWYKARLAEGRSMPEQRQKTQPIEI